MCVAVELARGRVFYQKQPKVGLSFYYTTNLEYFQEGRRGPFAIMGWLKAGRRVLPLTSDKEKVYYIDRYLWMKTAFNR
jgi:hypothetical protein